jgi:hypothetical protein
MTSRNSASHSFTAHDDELLAPSPWFKRAIPPTYGEPGLEQPCVSRRGHVQELDDPFLHRLVRSHHSKQV